ECYHNAGFFIACVFMHQGAYQKAWPYFELRGRYAMLTQHSDGLTMPKWYGEVLTGKTLLIIREQGLGDNLMSARFLDKFLEMPEDMRPKKIIIEVNAQQISLLRRSFSHPIFEFVTLHSQFQKDMRETIQYGADYYIFFMSLLVVFNVGRSAIPYKKRQFIADRSSIEQMRRWVAQKSPDANKKRIAITWSTKSENPNIPDHMINLRSMCYYDLLPLGKEKDVQLFMVQMQIDSQIAALQKATGAIDCREVIETFDDTAALLSALDAVVTIDTACLHIAGGLGLPTFCAIPYHADWRAAYDENGLLWYPDVRPFQQRDHRQWSSVITEIGAALRAFQPARWQITK
ncbi:MAG: hypothetical protein AAF352_08220, partial [Pseudomonadota bacterium]